MEVIFTVSGIHTQWNPATAGKSHVFYPSGKPIIPYLLCCQGVAVRYDSFTLDALDLRNRPYLRLAHGWATPCNLGEIISCDIENDKYSNQLSSIFYEHPLTDELFGFPLDIYLTPGFVWH